MEYSDQGLVIAAHGSLLDPDSARPAFLHACTLRNNGHFGAVRETYWKEEPAFCDVLDTLACETVYVVPLFMSEGYFVDRVLPRELGGRQAETCDVIVTEPVGTHPSMCDVILHRAERVTGDPHVGDGTGLAIVGHGTERHAASDASTRTHASTVRAMDRFDEVHALFLDEPPYIGDLPSHFDADEIVVVPFFVADGYHTKSDIPRELGLSASGDDARSQVIDDRRIWYSGAIGTDPRMADVILERAIEAGASRTESAGTETRVFPRTSTHIDALLGATPVSFDGLDMSPGPDGYDVTISEVRHRELSIDAAANVLASHPEHVSNWFFWNRYLDVTHPGRVAFLRLLEHAGTKSVAERYAGKHRREWGEVWIETTITDRGRRHYRISHETNRADDDLTAADNPEDAFEIARYDATDRYRSLRSAPTLTDGWILTDIDEREVLQAIGYLYPASIELWHLSRTDQLDITHWNATAARQSGIYADIANLPIEAIEWAVQACCTDATCIKRRMWDFDEETSLEPPRGDGSIPCRGPCAFFISAAKEWLAIEQESDDVMLEDPQGPETRGVSAPDIPVAEFGHPDNPIRKRYLAAKHDLADESFDPVTSRD